jgi:hypothetical protein
MKTESKREDISHDEVLQHLHKIWLNKGEHIKKEWVNQAASLLDTDTNTKDSDDEQSSDTLSGSNFVSLCSYTHVCMCAIHRLIKMRR